MEATQKLDLKWSSPRHRGKTSGARRYWDRYLLVRIYSHIHRQNLPSETSTDVDVIEIDTEWSREAFAEEILATADRDGLQNAIEKIVQNFPWQSDDNAMLWIAYLKDIQTKGDSVNAFVMDTFRTVDWYRILQEGQMHEVVVSGHG